MPEQNDQYQKTTISLPALHDWKCKAGNNLFVAERGAVAFEIPTQWVIHHAAKTLSIHDQDPPADQARISVTIFPLPPIKGGWGRLSLDKMLRDATDADSRAKKKKTVPLRINRVSRPDVELIWAEKEAWKDPANGRMIRCRQILGRARLVQCLITFETYQDVAEKFETVWDDLLSTLKVAIPRDLLGRVGN